MVAVKQTASGDPMKFAVTVSKGRGETRHQVTMGKEHFDSMAQNRVEPADFINAAFHFLLEREPKESILSSFDVTVISHYFPNFSKEIGKYF